MRTAKEWKGTWDGFVSLELCVFFFRGFSLFGVIFGFAFYRVLLEMRGIYIALFVIDHHTFDCTRFDNFRSFP